MQVMVMIRAEVIDGCILEDITQAEVLGCKSAEVLQVNQILSKSDELKLVDRIFSAVSMATGVTRKQMQSKHRKREKVQARFAVAYLLRGAKTDKGNHFFTEKLTGQYLGDRDHTTIIHAVRQTQNLIDTNDIGFQALAEVIKNFKY